MIGSMRIYLAGPMRGLPRFGLAAFEAVAGRLRLRGDEVHTPIDGRLAVGFDLDDPAEIFDQDAAMRINVAALARADTLAMLPGGEHAPEVEVERLLADIFGVPEVAAADL